MRGCLGNRRAPSWRGCSRSVADAQSGFATKGDWAQLRGDWAQLRAEWADLRVEWAEFKVEQRDAAHRLEVKMEGMRVGLERKIDGSRAELKDALTSHSRWLVGLLIGQTATLAAMGYFALTHLAR